MAGGDTTVLSGRCLCGGVKFELESRDLRPASACHCSQCRQFAGHFWAAVNAPIDDLRFVSGERLVKWHRSSDIAKRGFCRECGASMFYTADRVASRKGRIAVALGCLAAPTGLRLADHIFVADKGDYYDIADGLPQFDRE